MSFEIVFAVLIMILAVRGIRASQDRGMKNRKRILQPENRGSGDNTDTDRDIE